VRSLGKKYSDLFYKAREKEENIAPIVCESERENQFFGQTLCVSQPPRTVRPGSSGLGVRE